MSVRAQRIGETIGGAITMAVLITCAYGLVYGSVLLHDRSCWLESLKAGANRDAYWRDCAFRPDAPVMLFNGQTANVPIDTTEPPTISEE